MKNWNEIRPKIEEILSQQRVTTDGGHKDELCFLSCYQIAVLLAKYYPELVEEELPIGGKGEGCKANNQSLAQQIARQLSTDINKNQDNDPIEIRFFSRAGLSAFKFDDDNEPSLNEFSMFRIKK